MRLQLWICSVPHLCLACISWHPPPSQYMNTHWHTFQTPFPFDSRCYCRVQHFLEARQQVPAGVAYDRPSPKLLGFLEKYFGKDAPGTCRLNFSTLPSGQLVTTCIASIVHHAPDTGRWQQVGPLALLLMSCVLAAGLTEFIPQNNNFVVFRSFWDIPFTRGKVCPPTSCPAG